MQRSRQGDDVAFTQLVKRYEKELYHFLARFCNSESLGMEVFQETFLQVFLSADRFQTDRSFRPWLYTIASNKARDALRKQSRRPAVQLGSLDEDKSDNALWDSLLRDENSPDQILEAQQTTQRVRQVVAAMPDHLREILILAYFQQLPYKEIAEMLNIPLGTVKSRLHAAVTRFGKDFGPADHAE